MWDSKLLRLLPFMVVTILLDQTGSGTRLIFEHAQHRNWTPPSPSSDSAALVVAPSTFRIGVQETIFIHPFLSKDEEVNVTLSLDQVPPGNEQYFNKTVLVRKNEPLLTTLTLTATSPSLIRDLEKHGRNNKKVSSDAYVVMKASLQGHTFYRSPRIKVALNSGTVFLQTDKPIYAPGQEVKLRIIQTDNVLKALDENLILEVVNPKNLIVYKTELKNFPQSSILRYAYFLGPEPILGLWTINVRSGYQFNSFTNTTFAVQEYVLPTFDVGIVSEQRYISPETQTLEGKVIARYTFGEPVEGSVALQYFIRTKTGELQKAFNETKGHLTQGELPFKINLTKMREESPSPVLSSWFPDITGSRLRLEAIVTEVGTLTRESATNEAALFVTSPFIISFSRSLPDFKPGYSYTIQVDVHYANGDPAVGVPVLVPELYIDDIAQPQPPSQVTNSKGRVAFDIAVPKDAKYLLAEVYTIDPNYSEEANAMKQLALRAHEHPAKLHLWLESHMGLDEVHVGSTIPAKASVYSPANVTYTLHHLVVARGRVVSWGKSDTQEGPNQWVLNITIKPEMSPSFRILAYALPTSFGPVNSFLADSLRVEVEKKCPYNANRELKLSFSQDTFTPKDKGFLKIQGEHGSYAAVMAVDQAIYLLRNESILTRAKLFSEMDKADLGHGPGGGHLVGHILKNAGLVVLIPSEHNVQYKGVAEEELKDRPISSEGHECCRRARTGYNSSTGSCDMPIRLYCSVRDLATCIQQFLSCCPNQEKFEWPRFNCTGFRRHLVYHTHPTGGSGAIGHPRPRPHRPMPRTRLRLSGGRSGGSGGGMRYSSRGISSPPRPIDPPEDDEEELYSPPENDQEEELYSPPTDSDVRTEFPETWLYEDFELGGSRCPTGKDGDSCQLPIEAFPDSITTWNFHGLAVSNKTGLCIADPVQASVKQPWFIQLKLPYAAVRTEMLQVIATVFNYLNESLKVQMYMTGVEGLCSEAKPGAKGKSHWLMVPSNGVASHRFHIVPKRTGEFSVNVTALSKHGADVVIKPLKVRDEGIRETKSSSQLLDPINKIQSRGKTLEPKDSLQGATKGLENKPLLPPGKFISSNPDEKWTSVAWDVMPPTHAIPGTVRANVELTGSVLGPTLDTSIQGVEGFFQDAVGCAEQSMIRIAPTLYGAMYLKATGQLTPSYEEKAKKHLTQGYGFVLKYQQSGGGISVWAGPEHNPTVWLTSYFVRVFCEMRPFVSSVQSSVISAGLEWMAKNQKPDGSFNATNLVVHHPEMTGGLQGPTSLTAFTLTSYLACKDVNLDEDGEGAVSKARAYLEDKLESLKGHPYALALVTYVLALSNSSKAQLANGYLRTLAKEDEQGNRYWTFEVEELQAQDSNKPWIYKNKPSALSVEITAYALLAQVTLDDMDYAGPIVAWLIGQRNSKGAFVSTQDTAVTLEALAAYGKKAKQFDEGKTTVNVFVNDVQVNNESLIFDVNSKDFANIIEVPIGKRVNVTATGEFPISATLEIKYNRPGKSDSKNAYDIEIGTTEVIGGKSTRRDVPTKHAVLVHICIKYKMNKTSGMVIARVGIPTGYQVDQTHLRQVIGETENGITNMEAAESSLILYFDKIPREPEEQCFLILLRQTDQVQELQPSSVHVYTYYEPDEETTKFYSISSTDEDTTEQCKGEICSCIQGSCPVYLEAEAFSAAKTNSELDELIDKMITKGHYCYLVQILSVNITEDTMHLHQRIFARISRVIREGRESANDVLHQDREFYMPSQCDAFKINSYVLISGEKIELLKTITNEDRYILDETAVVLDFPSSFVSEIPKTSIFHHIIQRLKEE